MLELAARYGDRQPVRLKDVADAHRIPQRFLVQILLQLKASGLVVSTRGASGGYQLGRPPDQIALSDVVGVIDRADGPPARGSPAASPAVEAVRGAWQAAWTAQQRVLEETTLADLLEKVRGEALVFQI